MMIQLITVKIRVAESGWKFVMFGRGRTRAFMAASVAGYSGGDWLSLPLLHRRVALSGLVTSEID